MSVPSASCPRREEDFGGCRCQAFALTGAAAATDPVCHLSPVHDHVATVAAVQHDAPYVYRRVAPAKAFSGKVESGFPSENATMQKSWSGFSETALLSRIGEIRSRRNLTPVESPAA